MRFLDSLFLLLWAEPVELLHIPHMLPGPSQRVGHEVITCPSRRAGRGGFSPYLADL